MNKHKIGVFSHVYHSSLAFLLENHDKTMIKLEHKSFFCFLFFSKFSIVMNSARLGTRIWKYLSLWAARAGAPPSGVLLRWGICRAGRHY